MQIESANCKTFIQIKKGELVLAELPAVVVQDGGDLAASELSIDHFGVI